MKLKELFQALADGKKITRRNWRNNLYVYMEKDKLCNQDGKLSGINFHYPEQYLLYIEPQKTLKERVMKYKGKWIRYKHANNNYEVFVDRIDWSGLGFVSCNGSMTQIYDVEKDWEIVE